MLQAEFPCSGYMWARDGIQGVVDRRELIRSPANVDEILSVTQRSGDRMPQCWKARHHASNQHGKGHQ